MHIGSSCDFDRTHIFLRIQKYLNTCQKLVRSRKSMPLLPTSQEERITKII